MEGDATASVRVGDAHRLGPLVDAHVQLLRHLRCGRAGGTHAKQSGTCHFVPELRNCAMCQAVLMLKLCRCIKFRRIAMQHLGWARMRLGATLRRDPIHRHALVGIALHTTVWLNVGRQAPRSELSLCKSCSTTVGAGNPMS